jgi:hypothetical protein
MEECLPSRSVLWDLCDEKMHVQVHHVKNSIKSKWILPKNVGVMKRQFSNAEEIFKHISGQQFNLGGVRCEMKICCADIDHALNIGE